MIWPEHGLLRAGGEAFVIDAYSQGAMYSMTEVSAIVMLFLIRLHDYPGTTDVTAQHAQQNLHKACKSYSI